MSSSTSWWLEQIGRTPLLTPQQELVYGRQVREWLDHPEPCPPDIRRRGLRARERFTRANLRLVVRVAKRFRRMVAPQAFDDLIQAGNQGLIEAVERFDPARGYRFSTYATFWIQMRVTTHLERSERIIRLPTTISPKVAAIPRTVRKLQAHLGREPTREELAEALRTNVNELDRLATVGRPTASLDAAISLDDGLTTLGQMLASPAPAELGDDVRRLQAQIQQLPARARHAIQGSYGIGRGVATLGELAKELRLTRAATQELIEQSLASLRGELDPPVVQVPLLVCDEVPLPRPGAVAIKRRHRKHDEDSPQLCLAISLPAAHRGSRAPRRSGKARARV